MGHCSQKRQNHSGLAECSIRAFEVGCSIMGSIIARCSTLCSAHWIESWFGGLVRNTRNSGVIAAERLMAETDISATAENVGALGGRRG